MYMYMYMFIHLPSLNNLEANEKDLHVHVCVDEKCFVLCVYTICKE